MENLIEQTKAVIAKHLENAIKAALPVSGEDSPMLRHSGSFDENGNPQIEVIVPGEFLEALSVVKVELEILEQIVLLNKSINSKTKGKVSNF